MSARYVDARLYEQQQDALRRVRETQERAQRTVEQTNARTAAQTDAPVAPMPPAHPQQSAFASSDGGTRAPSSPGLPRGNNNILSQLFAGAPRGAAQNGGHGHPASGRTPGQSFGGASSSVPPAAQGAAAGLLEQLRGKGLTDSIGSLGDTLQGTIASVSEPLSKLLDAFDIDGEKLIILIVMWIIFNERGDKTLLLALGYLLL